MCYDYSHTDLKVDQPTVAPYGSHARRWRTASLGTDMKTALSYLGCLAAVGCGLLTGCAYPNQFRNISRDQPHAVLIGQQVVVDHINGQPTSFWRSGEQYRIPTGDVHVVVFSERGRSFGWEPIHYPQLEFHSDAGSQYTITHQRSNDADRVTVWKRISENTRGRVIAETGANQSAAQQDAGHVR